MRADLGLQSDRVPNMPNTHLATYLNDHLAGAATALEILESLKEHEDSGVRTLAHALRQPILEDRDELTRLMREAAVPCRRALDNSCSDGTARVGGGGGTAR